MRLFLLLIITLFSTNGYSATLYVDKNASNGTNDGSSWNNAFLNINSAITAATADDTVLIAQGTYFEGFELNINKPLFIKGGYPTGGGTQNIDTYPTLIDGSELHRVINYNSVGNTLYLEGLTIQNGYLDSGFNPIDEPPMIEELIDGCGILNLDGNLTLIKCKVINNYINDDYGGYSNGSKGSGIYNRNGNLLIINSIINNNIMHDTSPYFSKMLGAGIYIENSNATLINSQFNANEMSTFGDDNYFDGIGMYVENGNVDIINCEISNNTTQALIQANGGGLYNDGGILNIVNSTISNNSIWSLRFLAFGGGIFNSGNLTLSNCQILKNTAQTAFDGTTNTPALGGGIYTNSLLTVNNCQITNNLVISNDPNNSNGGGIYGSVTLNNSIIWNNFVVTNYEDADDAYSQSEHFNGTLNANHSLIKNENLGSTNIDATVSGFDPLFVDESNEDYALQSGSPLIDMGNNSYLPLDAFDIDNDGNYNENIPFDFLGNNRVMNSVVDIGSIEYQETLMIDSVKVNDLNIHPNPVKNIINLTNLKKDTTISIFNILGQVTINSKILIENPTIDISKLTSGTYFIKVDNIIFKFIKI